MTETTHQENHSSAIKTPGQLIAVVLVSFVVTITLLVLLAKYAATSLPSEQSRAAMSEEEVAKRLKPVGEVVLAEAGAPNRPGATLQESAGAEPQPEVKAAAPETQPAGEAAAAPAAAASGKGKSVFDANCSACHATGVAGAPKPGDKAAWAPRLAAGKSSLYTSALKGKAAMPPKGGNASLSDANVKAAVDYLVSQAK